MFAALTPRQFVWPLVGLVTIAGALVVLGAGASLLLAGAWVLSMGLSRTIPAVRAPAAWAFAVISDVTIVLVLSGVSSLISPHEQPPVVNLAILAGPVVIGGILLAIASRRGKHPGGDSPFFARIAITVTAVAVAGAGVLNARGASFGIAWAMSGDARNHLLIMRKAIFNGGITVDQVRSYPAAINAVAGVVSGATPRTGLPSGELLLHDTRALAAVYVVLIIAVACMIVAALAAFLPADEPLLRGSRVGVTLVFGIAAASSVSPLVLGTALIDGSFSAYGGLAICLAATVIALSTLEDRVTSPVKYVFLAPAALVLFVTWTILAIVPVGLSLAIATRHVIHVWRRRRLREQIGWTPVGIALMSLPVITTAVLGGAILVNLRSLETTFRFSGSITPVNVWLFPLLAALFVVSGLTTHDAPRRHALAALSAMGLSLVVVVWLMHLPAGWHQLKPTYYSQKTTWLVASCFIWVTFLPALRLAVASRESARGGRHAVASGLAAIVVWVALSAMTTVPEPLSRAADGWAQPSATVITQVAAEADDRPSFVLWNYAGIGDDRLGNFWSALAWTTTPSGGYKPTSADLTGGFAYWAYFESGQIEQLCKLVHDYPDITVITSTSATGGELSQSCPSAKYDLEVLAPASR